MKKTHSKHASFFPSFKLLNQDSATAAAAVPAAERFRGLEPRFASVSRVLFAELLRQDALLEPGAADLDQYHHQPDDKCRPAQQSQDKKEECQCAEHVDRVPDP